MTTRAREWPRQSLGDLEADRLLAEAWLDSAVRFGSEAEADAALDESLAARARLDAVLSQTPARYVGGER